MREFEKWRNEQKVSGRSHKADARVWQAALECVRDEMLASCDEPMDIYDFIKEELHEN